MTNYWTGIGSRSTPEHIQKLETRFAQVMAGLGLILRSGHAVGSDRAFELGAQEKSEIYVPWKGFGTNPYPRNPGSGEYQDFGMAILGQEIIMGDNPNARELVSRVHPAWNTLSNAAQKLHARNAGQVLGQDLLTPSRFVVAYTPGGEIRGGTATAINLALVNNIPVFNLGNNEGYDDIAMALANPASFFAWVQLQGS